ncbi:MAG TPA: plastocyanin/azurin family copper-binding protein [Actinomycetota bacterium]|nr:plastocyanin/azurin family copper-binding protein [Actinomycetota bacterium]
MRTSAAALLLVLLAGCSGSDANTVAMSDARLYEPETLTVSVGDTVRWMNESDEAHSVTAYESELPEGAEFFSSSGQPSEADARDHIEALMTAGDEYSVKFDVPGTYEYFCVPHEAQGMRGKIVVED